MENILFFIVLFLIAVLTLIAFTVFVLKKVGINNLPSFSDSYYQLKEIKDWYKYLFQGTLAIMALCLTPVILQFTPEKWQFLAFFTSTPILFVALAPRFSAVDNKYSDQEKKVHSIAAIISGISSCIWVVVIGLWWLIPVISLFAFVAYLYWKQLTWWAEMACFAWTIVTLGYTIFLLIV